MTEPTPPATTADSAATTPKPGQPRRKVSTRQGSLGEHRQTERPTRLGSLHAGLIAAAVALILLVVFIIQNKQTVTINFLGVQVHVSLAVALLVAAIAGALLVGAAGAARIAQLRRSLRRAVRRGEGD